MSNPIVQLRILVVTPEVVFVPGNEGKRNNFKKPLQSGFAGFLSGLISHLFELGAGVHVAQPDYRKIFAALLQGKRNTADSRIPGSRVHLAEDRMFFYSNPIGSNSEWENKTIAIAFQREVSHQIVPRVQPDLIHCHDWMTGLIPAMARRWRIPCLFTFQNLSTAKSTLSNIENEGIDGASIWRRLYYDRYPGNYENTRDTNAVDFLLSGILAADYVNTANPALLSDILKGQNEFFDTQLRQVLAQKDHAGCAGEIFSLADPFSKTTGNKEQQSFYDLNAHHTKRQETNRIMEPRTPSFSHWGTAQHYINLYEQILQRPLVQDVESFSKT